MSKLSK